MRKNWLLLFLFFSSYMFSQDFAMNQIIVKFKDETYSKIMLTDSQFGIEKLDFLNQTNNLTKINFIGQKDVTKTFVLTFHTSKSVKSLVEEYLASNEFEYAEPNYIAHGSGVEGKPLSTFPNDTYFNSRQWGLYNNGTFTVSGMPYTSTVDADVDMELAWDIETGDPNLIIAVPDTGLNMLHEDIAARVFNKTNEPIDGIDNDGNGLIDDYRGWDWVNNDNNPTDDHGHGTNCTGIVGAIANNSKGYAGANWNSKIMPLKVLDSGNSGSYSNMASCIYYAVDNGAKIISMSIGGGSSSPTLANAVDYANSNGVVLVACMMNFNDNVTYYPAGYALSRSNVIAVGSTNSNDKRTNPFFWSSTSGSNFGSHISVVAPGNYIWGLSNSGTAGYNSYWGGTSQATPLVAGIASLLKSNQPSLTPSQIKTIINTTAQDQVGIATEDVAGWDQYMGWGRVNAYNALSSPSLNVEDFDASLKISVVNPVRNQHLKIYVSNSLDGTYESTLITFEGKKVNKQTINLTGGENNLEFNYPKGNYILTLKGNRYTKVFKIVNQ